MNKTTGQLTMRPNTPAGSYWLKVWVSDDVWPDVVSGVKVHVRELEELAIRSSASLRLRGTVAVGRGDAESHNCVVALPYLSEHTHS